MDKEKLEKDIERLYQEIEELKKAHKTSESSWHRSLGQVVFYGAVASSITSIVNLVLAVINFAKK